jgi:hypothetical protein
VDLQRDSEQNEMITSFINFAEALAFAAFVALYMWRLQASQPETWLIFPAWLILSFAIHRDTPKTLGWRAHNLWPATRRAAPVFLIFIGGLLVAGAAFGAFHRAPSHFLDSRRLVGYFAFCVLQQVALQSMTMNRLLDGLRDSSVAAVIGGLLFGALHWPNPVLVPLTVLGGTAMCWLFAKERNILPLFMGQTILGGLVWWAFPIAWHHSMRVGPGYYTFVPH